MSPLLLSNWCIFSFWITMTVYGAHKQAILYQENAKHLNHPGETVGCLFARQLLTTSYWQVWCWCCAAWFHHFQWVSMFIRLNSWPISTVGLLFVTRYTRGKIIFWYFNNDSVDGHPQGEREMTEGKKDSKSGRKLNSKQTGSPQTTNTLRY